MTAHVSIADLLERSEDPAVREHLASCPSCRARSRLVGGLDLPPPGVEEARAALAGVIERAASALSESLSTGVRLPDDDDDPLEPGRVLDRYVVEARLGAGGMGTVYRVRHVELGSLHGLKVLRGRSREERQRLLREGRAQARLRHPNVVQVTDVIEVDGAPALILELVEGPTLARRLRDGPPIDPALADSLAQGILRGVAAAHRLGIVHRDLKPSNVLLAETDGAVVPKVTDFGLARQTRQDDTEITRSQVPLGTPAYMAPEQIRDASRAGPRSDVFSLGALLYELVSGRRAYDGRSVVDVYEKIRAGPPPSLAEVAPAAPPRWSEAIARALALDPEDRFADADALLAAWRGEVALPARRPGRVRRWSAPVAVAAIGIVIAAIALTGRRPTAPSAPRAPPAPAVEDRRLTARPNDLQVFGFAVSPDGSEIALADSLGVTRQSIDEGWTLPVLRTGPYHDVDYFPDGKRLLLRGVRDGVDGVWSVALDGSDPVLLAKGSADFVRLSPDGQRFVVADPTGLWVHEIADGSRRRIRPLGGADATAGIAWSPSGRMIAAIHRSAAGEGAWLEVTSADGRTTRRLLVEPGLLSLSLAAITWLPPDRLVFRVDEHDEDGSRLFVLDGAETAADTSAAVEVRRFDGFAVTQVRSSLDGRRVVYARISSQAIPYVLDLRSPDPPRRLGDEAWDEEPVGWGSPEVVWLLSSRTGGAIVRRRIDAGPVEPLVPGVPCCVARLDEVGDDLVFLRLDEAARRARVIRAPAEEIASFPYEKHQEDRYGLRCRGGRCLISTTAGPELRFSWIDPATGAVERVPVQVPADARAVAWDLAPDARRLAFASPPARIEVHDLATGAVERWPTALLAPHEINWGPEGDRIYVGGLSYGEQAYQLLEVTPAGERTLWTSMAWFLYRPTPSPDGRHLAFAAAAFDDDLWLAEGL